MVKFILLAPVYNVENYVDKFVQSILSQTFSDFELILVDDGSTDRSGTICDLLSKTDRRIVVLHKKHEGLMTARQYDLRYTKMKYAQPSETTQQYIVINLDSDDTMKPFALERIHEAFSHNPCDMVIYGYDRTQNNKVLHTYERQGLPSTIISDRRKLYVKVLIEGGYSTLWRKAMLLQAIPDEDYSSYYSIQLGEDVIQSLAMYKAAKRVMFLEESLYNYEKNPSSLTCNVHQNFFDPEMTVEREVEKFLIEENVLTQEDWDLFHQMMFNRLSGKIVYIIRMKRNYHEKLDCLHQLSSCAYYKEKMLSRKTDLQEMKLLRRTAHLLFQRRPLWPILVLGGRFYPLYVLYRQGIIRLKATGS